MMIELSVPWISRFIYQGIAASGVTSRLLQIPHYRNVGFLQVLSINPTLGGRIARFRNLPYFTEKNMDLANVLHCRVRLGML